MAGIEFCYSRVYDELLAAMMGREISESDVHEGRRIAEQLEILWRKEGKKIVGEIEKAAGLRFRKKRECFLVQHMLYEAISSPLTLRMHKNVEVLRGILVHELLHSLLEEHGKRASKIINMIEGSRNFRLHLPVVLCERMVLENLTGSFSREKRVEDLDEVWIAANKLYPEFHQYHRGVLRFLQDVARGKIPAKSA